MTALPFSPAFLQMARAEREKLRADFDERIERQGHFEALAEAARAEAEELSRLILDLDEILGDASQLSLHATYEELRGEHLREIALRVLTARGSDDPIHYRAWFNLVVEDGYKVAGRDPLATFLTQVSRIESVERVGRRTGLYRLRAVA